MSRTSAHTRKTHIHTHAHPHILAHTQTPVVTLEYLSENDTSILLNITKFLQPFTEVVEISILECKI